MHIITILMHILHILRQEKFNLLGYFKYWNRGSQTVGRDPLLGHDGIFGGTRFIFK